MRKRFVSVFLVLSMLCSMMVIPSHAADAPSVELAIEEGTTFAYNATQPRTMTLSILLHNPAPSESNISGINFDLVTADSEKIQIDANASEITNLFGSASYNQSAFTGFNMSAAFEEYAITETDVTLMKIGLTLTAGVPVGEYTVSTNGLAVSSTTITDGIPMSDASITITVYGEISGEQSVAVTAPVKSATPQSEITATDQYTGAVTWKDSDNQVIAATAAFAANTVYTATVTLTAKDGYLFAADATARVTGAEISQLGVSLDGKTMTFDATFPATANAAITELEVATNLSDPVDAPLAGAAPVTVTLTPTATYDDNTTGTPAGVQWSVSPENSALTFEGNTLKIASTADAGTYTITGEAGGKTGTATVTVNKKSSVATTWTVSQGSEAKVPVSGETSSVRMSVRDVFDQYGVAMATPDSVSWSVEPVPQNGEYSIDASTGVLTLQPTASAGTIKVTSKIGDVSVPKDVTVSKDASTAQSIQISGGPGSMEVPKASAIGVPGVTTTEAAKKFTAAVTDQYGGAMSAANVEWSIVGNPAGVSIDAGAITVDSSAAAADALTVKAALGGKEATATFTLTKPASVATFVQILKNGTAITADTLKIPDADGQPLSTAYTAAVYDQYGAPMQNAQAAFSLSAVLDGVTLSGGTVTVDKTAKDAEKAVTLIATSNSKTAEVELSFSNLPAHEISFDETEPLEITYGSTETRVAKSSTTTDIYYVSSDTTILTVDENSGAVTAVKGSGTATITAWAKRTEGQYAANSASYTATARKAELKIEGLKAENRAYEKGNLDVTLTGGELSGLRNSDSVTLTMPTTGTLKADTVGTGIPVTYQMPTLPSGEPYDNYTLLDYGEILVDITPAVSSISGVALTDPAMEITTATALSDIMLTFETAEPAEGTLALKEGQTLTAGTGSYTWVFTPDDSNYAEATGTIELTIAAEGSATEKPDLAGATVSFEPLSGCKAADLNGAPTVTVTLDGSVLAEGTAYELVWTKGEAAADWSAVTAGIYTATITAKGRALTGSTTVKFVVKEDEVKSEIPVETEVSQPDESGAVEAVVSEDLAAQIDETTTSITISAQTGDNSESAVKTKVTLPSVVVDALANDASEDVKVDVQTDTGTVTLNSEALSAMSEAAGGENLSLALTGAGDKTGVEAAVPQTVETQTFGISVLKENGEEVDLSGLNNNPMTFEFALAGTLLKKLTEQGSSSVIVVFWIDRTTSDTPVLRRMGGASFENGKANFRSSHMSEYMVMSESDAASVQSQPYDITVSGSGSVSGYEWLGTDSPYHLYLQTSGGQSATITNRAANEASISVTIPEDGKVQVFETDGEITYNSDGSVKSGFVGYGSSEN